MKVTRKISAPAKINLTLDITGTEKNGYHTLESFMQTVSLSDTVTTEYFPEENFKISLVTFPENAAGCKEEDNLCFVAAEKFCEEFGIKKGRISITLEKRIPIKAGLGGGSSDCAAVIKSMAEIFGIKDNEKILSLASSLGSDVPFFLFGGLCKVSGTGNRIKPYGEKTGGYFLLVKPPEGLSAGEVYKEFDRLPFCKIAFSENSEKGGFSPDSFKNGLEKAAFGLCFCLSKIKEKLLSCGAENAVLCGSGTTVFGVFKTESEAEAALLSLKKYFKEDYFTAVCRPVYD